MYIVESKGIRAEGFYRNQEFCIKLGSSAIGEHGITSSFSSNESRVITRNKLIHNGLLKLDGENYTFTKDVVFNSPSEAASIVWGSNLNGLKMFGLKERVSTKVKQHYAIDSISAIEGYEKDKAILQKERNKKLMVTRKEMDNYTCQACGFSLKISGHYIIECHHLNPIKAGERETFIEELISLCPTCHRIVHTRDPLYSIEELRKIIQN